MPSRIKKVAEMEVPMMFPIWENLSNLVARCAAVAAVTREVMMTIL